MWRRLRSHVGFGSFDGFQSSWILAFLLKKAIDSIQKKIHKPKKMRPTLLPNVWCPNGKTPIDFVPELRGLFFCHLNQFTINDMLEMQLRCRNFEARLREQLNECIEYAQKHVVIK